MTYLTSRWRYSWQTLRANWSSSFATKVPRYLCQDPVVHGDDSPHWPSRLRSTSRWGRLSEGHADALAILADAGRRPVDGATYAVWASQSKSTRTVADRVPGGWQLSGRKEFCSGSGIVDRALLVAESNQGRLLLDIDVRQHVTAVVPDTWPSIGMSASRSDTLEFGGPVVAEDDVLGTAEFYVTRPGFWFGAIGVRRLLVWRSRWHRQRSLEVPGSRT